MSKKLKITPVGGVGQIGSNSTLIEYKDTTVLIDCGILFPSEDFFDINYLIPDLDSVESIPQKLFITHGHEDHIGAIVHFIQQYPHIEVWAPLFAKKLIENKLNYAKLSKKINLYNRDSILDFDDLELVPIQVNHSIPDTFGVVINNDSESIFLVSDFKIDLNSTLEPPFDFEKLEKHSPNRRTLLADSTNIMSKNLNTKGEDSTFNEFVEILKKEEGRVFVTTFSSNIFRIQNILKAAKETGRVVVPYGRSMKSYIQTAIDCEIIKDDKLIRQVESVDPKSKKLIILLTGCQGDFKGAFRRVAMNEDSYFKLNETDTFLLSSKAIPGNEKKISLLINSLYSFNTKVITADQRNIHVSGHPGKEDLRVLYNRFMPRFAAPIHGETAFIHEHVNWIKNEIENCDPILLGNFSSLVFEETPKVKFNSEPPQPILIHGNGIEIEKSVISQRRKLACNGTIFISINTESLNNKKLKFSISYSGIPEHILLVKKEDFEEYLETALKTRKIKLLEKTAEELRIDTRRFFNNILGYKPITIVHFV